MPKFKNYDNADAKKSLKNADREKIAENSLSHSVYDGFGGEDKENDFGSRPGRLKARRRLPIAVDIIIAVLLLAIVAAVIAGGYFALRFFTIDYDSVNIRYTVLVDDANVKQYADLAGKHLYMDGEGNTLYMGKVTDVKIYEADGSAVITVEFEAKYKSEEGYFADDQRIAVGKNVDVRTDGVRISGRIVELKRIGKAKRSISGIVSARSNMGILCKEGCN